MERKIWFTSDTHAFHKNIAGPKVSDWKDGFRNFNDEQEMSRHIVKIINQTVAENDILYHLGDWSFGGIHNIWNFRKQINCKNIHLIYGNHDEHIKNNKILLNCHVNSDNNIPYDNPPELNGTEYRCFAQNLFSSTQDVLTIKHGKHTFFLSHYSHQVWLGSHKGIIHLFGHSHDSIKGLGKSMDVGIDVAKRLVKEYRPFSIEEIISYMDKKEIYFPDHHTNKTNI